MKNIFTKLSFRIKVIGTTILLIITTCAALTLISVQVAETSLLNKTYENLTAVHDSKKSQIKRFFNERMGDIKVLAVNPFTREAFRTLKVVYDAHGGGKGGRFKGHTNYKYTAPTRYRAVHDRYYPVFKSYMEKYGYYDIFLIHADDGDTQFTVVKEADFGVILKDIDSSLRDVREKARKGEIAIPDTKPYAPSFNLPAQFIAAFLIAVFSGIIVMLVLNILAIKPLGSDPVHFENMTRLIASGTLDRKLINNNRKRMQDVLTKEKNILHFSIEENY